MNIIEVDVGKTKIFSIGQQYNDNALAIHFVNLPNLRNKFIYYQVDDIEHEIPLVDDLFIVSRPLTLHSGEVKAQIITRDDNNSVVELTKNFTMRIQPSNYSGIGEDENYPDDPNIKNYFVKIDEKVNSFEELANLVQSKLDNGEFVGARGPKGDPGEKGDPGDVTEEYRNLASQIEQNASDAQTSATNAQTSASNAQKAFNDTKEFANQTKSEMNQIKTDTNTLKDEANTSAVNAKDSETKAKEYADNLQASTDDISRLKEDLAGLQTVVDSKADKTDLAKTNICLYALYKLNKGQTYDMLEQESEAYSVDVPSGAKYVGIDKVGGKSIIWNQIAPTRYYHRNGIYADYSDGIISLRGTATNNYGAIADMPTVAEHYYYLRTKTIANPNSMTFKFGSLNKLDQRPIADVGESVAWISYQVKNGIEGIGFNNVDVGDHLDGIQLQLLVFDLTQMFGAGNEPSTVKEFEAMFPADYYPYSEPTIISSQTDRLDVASADGAISKQITTGFPVLNSAGSVYDYIDLNEGKLHRRVGVVDLGTFYWDILTYGEATVFRSHDYTGKKPLGSTHVANIICSDYESASANDLYSLNKDKAIAVHNGSIGMIVNNSSYTDATAFKEAMNGVILYYELVDEIITDIEIPTELTEWKTVETGCSITFHNADDGERLLIPNKETFIRKLDEVRA